MTDIASLLYSERDIQRRVAELGDEVTAHFAGRSPVLISVLKGGAMFLADLIRAVDLPLRVDFMSISRYRGSTSGVVRVLKDLDQDVGGEDVLVVEDIVDTGLTLNYLMNLLRARGPRSLKVAALLSKPSRRLVSVEADYTGFTIDDHFVVGYGLDYNERHRNLRDIVVYE